MRPNNNTLVPSLREKFSGLIWKVKIDESGLIAIESRNMDSKKVCFSSLNLITGDLNFKEKGYDESWNLSLASAGQNNLILTAFEHSQTPESKGIVCVDAKDGSIIWQQYNISLNIVNSYGLEIYDSRIQPRKYYWIDTLTATKIPVPTTVTEPEIIFPETINTFKIPELINHGPLVGELSVLNYSGKTFVSFHEAYDDHLKQRLIVYQGDKVLLDDILISGIQKLQPEAFFIQQNHLFYIRDKKEIFAYLV